MDNIYKEASKVNSNIRSFTNEDGLQGNNQKFKDLYNKIAPFYHLSQKLFYLFKFGGERAFRDEFLRYIDVKDTDLVLETSVGTADNFYYMNKQAHYFGVDISMGMLKRAVRHARKWKIVAEFICCEAEELPFEDCVFDVVFSCGGFNFYNNKQSAINEMIRVAKSGTRIFIIDETEKTVRDIYKSVPGSELYNIAKATIPLDLIPENMKNIKHEIICSGYMYIVEFEKP